MRARKISTGIIAHLKTSESVLIYINIVCIEMVFFGKIIQNFRKRVVDKRTDIKLKHILAIFLCENKIYAFKNLIFDGK